MMKRARCTQEVQFLTVQKGWLQSHHHRPNQLKGNSDLPQGIGDLIVTGVLDKFSRRKEAAMANTNNADVSLKILVQKPFYFLPIGPNGFHKRHSGHPISPSPRNNAIRNSSPLCWIVQLRFFSRHLFCVGHHWSGYHRLLWAPFWRQKLRTDGAAWCSQASRSCMELASIQSSEE